MSDLELRDVLDWSMADYEEHPRVTALLSLLERHLPEELELHLQEWPIGLGDPGREWHGVSVLLRLRRTFVTAESSDLRYVLPHPVNMERPRPIVIEALTLVPLWNALLRDVRFTDRTGPENSSRLLRSMMWSAALRAWRVPPLATTRAVAILCQTLTWSGAGLEHLRLARTHLAVTLLNLPDPQRELVQELGKDWDGPLTDLLAAAHVATS